MQSKVIVKASEYRGDATVFYENNELIFWGKPAWTAILFGMLGYALAKEKEKFRLNISCVVSLYVDESSRKKKTYVMTLDNNKTCTIEFKEEDELSLRLKNDLANKLR